MYFFRYRGIKLIGTESFIWLKKMLGHVKIVFYIRNPIFNSSQVEKWKFNHFSSRLFTFGEQERIVINITYKFIVNTLEAFKWRV